MWSKDGQHTRKLNYGRVASIIFNIKKNPDLRWISFFMF